MARRKLSKEEDLLWDFSQTGILKGYFIPELQVGRTQASKSTASSLKAVDAVCILSRRHEYRLLGLVGRNRHAGDSMLGKAREREGNLINDQPVALVEAKSGKLHHSAVGQLLVYKSLFKQDWPTAMVEQLWIVASEDDPFIRPACQDLGIKVWIKEPGSE